MTQAGAGENPICPAHMRIVDERLEAYVEGYGIDQWRNPEAIKIAQSDWPRRVVYPTSVPGVAAGWVPMRCRECAAEVAAAARVCSRCGAPIVGQQPVVADMVFGADSDTAVSDATGKAVPAGVAGQAPPEPDVPGSGDRVPAELRLVLVVHGRFSGLLRRPSDPRTATVAATKRGGRTLILDIPRDGIGRGYQSLSEVRLALRTKASLLVPGETVNVYGGSGGKSELLISSPSGPGHS